MMSPLDNLAGGTVMRGIAILVLAAAVAGPVPPVTAARAGQIEAACLGSDRSGGNRVLCGCIQSVADGTLSGRDQRQAAQFFADPHLAQEARVADRAGFWDRYKAFGALAEERCAGT